MSSGGHARSGPARDPYALKRGDNATAGWFKMTVPTDEPPDWPLKNAPSAREADVWASLWTRPQASAWPTFYLTLEVAVYTRTLVAFEVSGAANAALGNLLRRQADDLGLTVAGAARNQWLWPEVTRKPATAGRPASERRPSSRERFRVVAPAPVRDPRTADDVGA